MGGIIIIDGGIIIIDGGIIIIDGDGIIIDVKNTLNPIERKSLATCTREIIQVDINPMNAVHLKHVLIYRNARLTAAADDDEFYTMLEEILLSHHMNVSS